MKKFYFIIIIFTVLMTSACSDSKEVVMYEDKILELEGLIEVIQEENQILTSSLELQIIENQKLNDRLNTLQEKLKNEREITQSLEEEVNVLKEKYERWNFELNIIRGYDNELKYFIEEKDIYCQTINIIGSDKNTSIMGTDIEVTHFSGSKGGKELVKIKVFGSVYEFELLDIIYTNDLDNPDYKVKASKDIVRNEEIIIETTLPEGLPGEMIRWKDEKGNIYERYLTFDGIGFSGTIIFEE